VEIDVSRVKWGTVLLAIGCLVLAFLAADSAVVRPAVEAVVVWVSGELSVLAGPTLAGVVAGLVALLIDILLFFSGYLAGDALFCRRYPQSRLASLTAVAMGVLMMNARGDGGIRAFLPGAAGQVASVTQIATFGVLVVLGTGVWVYTVATREPQAQPSERDYFDTGD
jgi:hypothetical protein